MKKFTLEELKIKSLVTTQQWDAIVGGRINIQSVQHSCICVPTEVACS